MNKHVYKHLTLIKSGKTVKRRKEPDINPDSELHGFEAVIAFYHLEQEHDILKKEYENLKNYKDKLEDYCNYLKEVTNYKEIMKMSNTTKGNEQSDKHKT